jgi:type II secretory pathway pseudopilin PulG
MLSNWFLLNRRSSEKGFTLVEALVAVIVTGILITGVTPLIVFAVATRVQARKVDLANQAGTSYIEAVRAGTISLATIPTNLITTSSNVTTFDGINAPDQSTYLPLTDPSNPANPLPLRATRIDGNGNGFSLNDPFDLIIQPMRTQIAGGEPATVALRDAALRDQGYFVGVRVYRADLFGPYASNTPLKGNEDIRCGNRTSILTRGTGRVDCPLIVLRAEILPSPNNTFEIRRRLGN